MKNLVKFLADALAMKTTHGDNSEEYRAALRRLEDAFSSAVEEAMIEAFKGTKIRGSIHFRNAIAKAIDPTRLIS